MGTNCILTLKKQHTMRPSAWGLMCGFKLVCDSIKSPYPYIEPIDVEDKNANHFYVNTVALFHDVR